MNRTIVSKESEGRFLRGAGHTLQGVSDGR
jgi:hypothetical protein